MKLDTTEYKDLKPQDTFRTTIRNIKECLDELKNHNPKTVQDYRNDLMEMRSRIPGRTESEEKDHIKRCCQAIIEYTHEKVEYIDEYAEVYNDVSWKQLPINGLKEYLENRINHLQNT